MNNNSKTKAFETCLLATMAATNWTHDYASAQISDARARLGISYNDYIKYSMWEVPVEEQSARYKAALARKERKKLAKQMYIAKTAEKSGWTQEYAAEEMKRTCDRLGITYSNFYRFELYSVPDEDRDSFYQEKTAAAKKQKASDERKEALELRTAYLQKLMKATGWSEEEAESKIADARKVVGTPPKYNYFYKEYFLYRLYEMTAEEQKNVLLLFHSWMLTERYNVNHDFIILTNYKDESNFYFSKFLKRNWCINTLVSEEEFIDCFRDSQKIIYKPIAGHKGEGVLSFITTPDTIRDTYKTLSELPNGVVEEYVIQHPDLTSLCPSSVNTLRVVTVSSKTKAVTPDGEKIDVAYASLRIGSGDSVVDNFSSGGMVALVDMDTGKLMTRATDADANIFSHHPVTGVQIKGFQVPLFKEAVNLAKEACKMSLVEGYLGWDIAITENGPVLIEVNKNPGIVLISTPASAEGMGMKQVLTKYLWQEECR